MEIEVHHYEEINSLLRNFRRDRLLNSRGIVQRTFSFNTYQVQIQEEAERSVKSSVSDMDECLSLHVAQHFTKKEATNKSVIELASGCGLVGLIFGMLGCRVILTDCHQQLHLLSKNIEINNLGALVQPQTLNLDGEDNTAHLTNKFYDFVVATTDIEGVSADHLDKVIKTIVDLCGNGTRLIVAYRRSQSDSDASFRLKLDKYFDLSYSRMAFYETPKCEIVIVSVLRRPFSTFIQNFLAMRNK